ncbi:MAG: phosphate signaling complex protein PhoU [Actinomycetota bacterium]|nr:phosphate signaling complex protein PhoU [Actinomycetota bacterium]MDA3019140.1 phosphate signaling complex protein PhoU [Actinomycetota bacterium]
MNRLAHDELLELSAELLRVTASLVESIPRATQILLEQDLEGAVYQILADDEFDARTMDLEDRCIALMALHAPVASELRHAVTIMKMSADIERSADLVVNICKVARRIHGIQLDPKMRGLIGRMGAQAEILFRHAIQAYADLDLPMAKAVDDMDLFLDYLHRQFIESIFESHSAGTIDLSVAIQMAVTARFYERIGDHAVNVAHFVCYLITGEITPAGDHRRGGRIGDADSNIEGLTP